MPDNTLTSHITTAPDAINSLLSNEWLRDLRRMRGPLYGMDASEISSEFSKALNRIKEHNYIHYLFLIGDFAEILRILEENDLKEHRHFSNKEEEARKADAEELKRQIELDQDHLSQKKQGEIEELAQDQKRIEEEKALANMLEYQYLLAEKEHILHEFHAKQIQVYERAHAARQGLLVEAIGIILDDPGTPEEDRYEITNLHQEFVEEHGRLREISSTRDDGSVDFQEEEKQYRAWKRVEARYRELHSTLRRSEVLNVRLKELLSEMSERSEGDQSELSGNEEECKVKLTKIAPRLKETRITARADLVRHMGRSLEILKEYSMKNISSEKEQEFQDLLKELQNFKQNLARATNDDGKVRDLSEKFRDKMESIMHIVKPPVLEKEQYQELEEEFKFLNKLVGTYSPSVPNVLSVEAEDNEISISDFVDPSLGSPTVLEQEEVPDHSVNDPIPKDNDTSISLKLQETTKSFRDFLVNEKKVNSEVRIELDEESKNLLETTVGTLLTRFADIRDKGALSPEDELLISGSEKLCEAINTSLKKEFFASDIELLRSLQEKVDALKENHENLKLMAQNLEAVLDSFKNSYSSQF